MLGESGTFALGILGGGLAIFGVGSAVAGLAWHSLIGQVVKIGRKKLKM